MYKERLIEYIEDDAIYQEWIGTDNEDISDYDRFCIEHCQDIQNLLNEVEKLHNKIDKAIEYIRKSDTLYEFKEDKSSLSIPNSIVVDDYKYRKELIEILKDSDANE